MELARWFLGRGPVDQRPNGQAQADSTLMSRANPETPTSPDARSPLAIPDVVKAVGRPTGNTGPASRPTVTSSHVGGAPSASQLLDADVDGLLEQGQGYGWPEECRVLLKNVKAGLPLPDRISAASGLCRALDDFSLEGVASIWSAAKDLIDASLPKDARRAGFDLLAACVKQPNLSPLERRRFFKTLASKQIKADDFGLQLSALVELTNHGKDVSAFESVLLVLVSTLLQEWFHNAKNARRKAKEKKMKVPGGMVEENNLSDLFRFVKELVRFSFVTFQPRELSQLLDDVLQISKATTSETDIKHSVEVVDVLVTYGEVPVEKQALILEVLCGTYACIENLKDLTWKVIGNFCKSHLASNTVSLLLIFIDNCNDEAHKNTHSVRGSLLVIDGLLKARGASGLYGITFSVWVDAISNALDDTNGRFDLDVLHFVADFLQNESLLNETLQEEDLSRLFDVLTLCSRHVIDVDRATPIDQLLSEEQKNHDTKKENHVAIMLLEDMLRVFDALDMHYTRFTILEGPITRYYLSMRGILPDSSASLLLQHYRVQQLCHPSNESWLENMSVLVTSFFNNRQRHASLRLLALSLVQDVYKTASIHLSPEDIRSSFVAVIGNMQTESDANVLESLVALAVEVASHTHDEVFAMAMSCFDDCCRAFKDPTTSKTEGSSEAAPSTTPPHPASASASLQSATTAGVVRVFLRSMSESAARATKAFELLLEIARSQSSASTDARLTALKLLFRLRADSAFAISVVPSVDVETGATCLGRTVAMLDKRIADRTSHELQGDNVEPAQPNRRRSNQQLYRSMANAKTESRAASASAPKRPEIPLWIHPDPRGLPEDPPLQASEFLLSSPEALEPPLPSETSAIPSPKKALNIKMWLELVISNIREHNHWEVYSYTIVYLQSQLANHSLFADCVPQLQMLRSTLCDHIRANKFLDPNSVRYPKKADVAVCLFHLLAGLVSYHDLFSKNEQDDLVKTFAFGIGYWDGTARPCIHALAISCHEMPLSVSKSLNSILQKMSQIITQSQVAIHILEFLVLLSRLPETYVNLRDEEYRTIFAICSGYLQSVRDERKSTEAATVRPSISASQTVTTRTMLPSERANIPPNAAKDLPQYVYALAYHVITFWFLSLKLADRAKHVGWITKNLVWMDQHGNEVIDEQAQVTVDMMQRVTYSDFDETLPDARFASVTDESIVKNFWLVGMSILTVETIVATGESQITRRQPSATTFAVWRSVIAPRPSHQIPMSATASTDLQDRAFRAAVLPAHILLQMSATCAPTPDSLRPIPLPEDDVVKRAISSFDRISIVDGHKVGVIYVDEGQTNERDILANAGGSPDYNEFLARLGTLVRLKGATFNTQGLDREYDNDGEWAYCSRDRVTELVFHVTTMMPTNLEQDPECHLKKRHTGNDYVNIIFNNSGWPFEFDTFPSQFNFVNIVITPEASPTHGAGRPSDKQDLSDVFYTVRVMSKAGFPEISPAADAKVVSGKTLPSFVRTLALNASVFSGVWANRGHGDEMVSSWRSRLRQIAKLRERHAPTRNPSSSTFPTPPGTAGTTSSNTSSNTGGMMGQFHGPRDSHVQRESLPLNLRRTSAATYLSEALGGGSGSGVAGGSARSSVASTATGSDHESAGRPAESLVEGYDFSKWT